MKAFTLLDMLNGQRPAWMYDGLCNEYPQGTFFPVHGGEGKIRTSVAKAICNRCLVREECLQYALDTRQEYGVWGGKSERQRRAIRRQYAADQALVVVPDVADDNEQPRGERGRWVRTRGCGHDATYKRGCRCDACRIAHRNYNRKYDKTKSA